MSLLRPARQLVARTVHQECLVILALARIAFGDPLSATPWWVALAVIAQAVLLFVMAFQTRMIEDLDLQIPSAATTADYQQLASAYTAISVTYTLIGCTYLLLTSRTVAGCVFLMLAARFAWFWRKTTKRVENDIAQTPSD